MLKSPKPVARIIMLPDRVPFLTDNHVIKFKMHSEDGSRHCLVGWIYTCIPTAHGRVLVMTEMRKRMSKIINLPMSRTAVADFNDMRDAIDNSGVWNNTFEGLGYTREGHFWRK